MKPNKPIASARRKYREEIDGLMTDLKFKLGWAGTHTIGYPKGYAFGFSMKEDGTVEVAVTIENGRPFCWRTYENTDEDLKNALAWGFLMSATE